MTPTEEVIVTHAQEANHNAERAYWWMKGIDREEAQRLGLSDMVQSVLSLLQKVDNITMDIQITIKQKSK
ncbi:hypothetical protein [Prevotella sp. MGM2]|jgi:hypothetical protein|uniref:hypothetical protein n=1 Tax=Prevotella sp. MGM2 TaxID=2033406 RepID=UPI000CE9FC4A|nr:hypothetical protein [Prevotella sp. MGM2]GAY31513.1 hypothetical protein PvtlMGM2_2366 [Prevotella sp. MGM2]